MNWEGVLARYGWKKEVTGATEPFQPLSLLAQKARAQGLPVARVNASLSTALDFGQVKASFSVTVECPQDEPSINLAGECAFYKALELVNDAARYLGIPELPVRGT